MRIEFDSQKNRANMAKHGVSLSLAEMLDWDFAYAKIDNRFAYSGECRMIALVPFQSVVYCVVFVERGETMRVISLRKANRKEVMSYIEND